MNQKKLFQSVRKRFGMLVLSLLLVCMSVSVCDTEAEAKSKTKAKYEMKINKSVYTLKKGKSVKLKVKMNKAAKKKKVVWASSNKKVATVSSSGKVKAKKNGKAKITAKLKGTKVKVTCKIVVGTPVTSVKLNQSSARLKAGERLQLKAVVSPKKASNKKVTYHSSKPAVASVTSAGVVSALQPGQAKITATAADGTGKSASCTVTVEQGVVAVSAVTLSEKNLELEPGQEKKLSAAVQPASATNKTLTWESSNNEVVSVKNDGTVKAVAEGTAIVKATAHNGVSAQCSVKVSYSGEAGSQTELEQALSSKMLTKVTYNSNAAGKVDIPAGDYSEKTLEINAPNAEVTNAGQFEKVVINAIASNTYSENAKNIIFFNADKGRVIVGKEGMATINLDAAGKREFHLENNGVVNDVHVAGQTVLRFEGDNAIPVTLSSGAKNSVITTSAELRITSAVKWNMTMLPGSENSKATVKQDDCIPEVEGVGYIPVTVSDGEKKDIVNVFAEMNDNPEINQKVAVEGRVSEYYLSDEPADDSGDTPEKPEKPGDADDTDTPVETEPEDAQEPLADDSLETGEDVLAGEESGSDEDGLTGEDVLAGEEPGSGEDDPAGGEPGKGGNEGAELRAVNRDSEGAEVFLLKYTKENSDINEENCDKYISSAKSVSTNANGNFEFTDARIGNYWLIIRKSEYKSVVKSIVITSNNTNFYSCGKIELLSEEIAACETAPEISGSIIEGVTGEPVSAAGIQVKLRSGAGNIIGKVLQTTETDKNGRYSFSNVPAGVYTIEVLDVRTGLSENEVRYNSSSADIVVAGAYLPTDNYRCTVEQQMQDQITGQGQVQFTLTWGKKESGASADIDSHLIGPRADGKGAFHVYYADSTYYASEGVKAADLDVDDTDYEGPEHTTIYKETNGIYHFYIHNYSESGVEGSDMLSKSSVQVRVTIGDNSYYFNCPNKKGNLWYVCEYNSMTHTIIPVNEMSDFLEDEAYIGLSEEDIAQIEKERQKEELLYNIKAGREYLYRFIDNSAKTQMLDRIQKLEDQVKTADETAVLTQLSDKLEELRTELRNAYYWLQAYADNLLDYESDVNEIYDDDGETVISVRSELICSVLTGSELKNFNVSIYSEEEQENNAELTINESTDPEYAYVVNVVAENGLEYDVYVRVLSDQASVDLLRRVRECREEISLFEENESIRVDKQRLSEIIAEAEELKDEAAYDTIKMELQDIYSKYSQISEKFSIDTVKTGSENVLGDWWSSTREEYDENDSWLYSYAVLVLERNAGVTDEAILGKLELGFTEESVTYEITDSDREGYAKVIKITDGEFVQKRYIEITEY